MDYEKASSLSSDESMQISAAVAAAAAAQGSQTSKKLLQHSPSTKYRNTTPNTLLIQPFIHLGQSLPNLNLNVSHTTNNTLLVPGTSSGHSNLLSPSQRGISYPPPSPTRYLFHFYTFTFCSFLKQSNLIWMLNFYVSFFSVICFAVLFCVVGLHFRHR